MKNKSRSELNKEGMLKALEDDRHIPYVYYVPADFVLQKHWWGKKAHYDLRIHKKNAVTWFGFTLFKNPLKFLKNKIMAIGKGYGKLVVPNYGKRPKLESLGDIKWMTFSGEIPIGSPGNPTKNYIAYMKIIDKGKCIIHRREKDFFDGTFFGKKLKGRYYIRLVNFNGEPKMFFWRAKRQFTKEELRKIKETHYVV